MPKRPALATERFNFYTTPALKKAVHEFADNRGLPVSSVIRDALAHHIGRPELAATRPQGAPGHDGGKDR